MKRTRYISLIIALLSVFGLAAQQQQSQYALYNYRNDGDFNAWLNIDVDSITYSNIGLDSVEYDNIVTQEVWTPDSCYRIPIEVIDSIGFRAPETKYKEGVFFLNEEHEPYVRIIDDLKITFNSATPTHLLPSVGQVICTETSYGVLEEGFAGRAVSVSNTDDGLEFTCEEVSLSDIFDQFIYVSKCSSTEGGDPQEYRAKSSRKRIFDYAIGIDEVIPIDLKEVETPKKIDGEDMPIQFKYKPEMEITCLISVVKGQPVVAKVTFQHSHTMSLGMDYEGNLFKPKSKEWWFSKDDIRIHIPVAAVDAVIKPYVNFGAFVDYNAKVKFEYELPLLKFEQTFVVDYSEYRKEEDRLQFYNDTEFIHDDPTISLSLDGALAFGLAMKIGAKLIHKRLLNFEATFHVGPEFKGHIDLSTDRIGEDANLYRQLKSATLDLCGYVAIPRASYQYFGSGVKLAKRGTWKGAKWVTEPKTEDLLPNEDNPEGIMIDWPIKKWYILPEFYKPEIYEANATAAVASVQPHRNLLFPVGVGIAFKDYVTGEVVEKDCDSYWGTKHNAESNYTTTFEDLTPSSVYKVYPTVSLLGIKMDAEPSVDYSVAGKLIMTPSSITIKKGEEAEVIIFGAMGNLQAIDDDPSIAKSLSIIYDHRTGQHITLHVRGVSVGSTYITVQNRSNGSSCIVRVYVVDTDKPVTGITLSQTTLSMQEGSTQTLAATVMPEDAENKTVAWESSNEAVATVSTDGLVTAIGEGTCVITCSATDGSGVYAECQVTVTSGTIPDPDNHEWVDLGLPSGTLWAMCNVGANSPEEYGDYFAWGETEPKSEYTIDNYTICNTPLRDFNEDGAIDIADFVAYINHNNPDIAGTPYDVAYVRMGASWCLPSEAQTKELINNCSRQWTEINGVSGIIMTGPNGRQLFLPAAGYKIDSSIECLGLNGNYMDSQGGGLYFNSNSIRYYKGTGWGGWCVRPVRAQGSNVITNITLNETLLRLQVGETHTLTATVMPEDAENKTVAWESSNEAVATVSTDGLVTAVAEGSCVITCSATDGSGVKDECQVTVKSGTTPDPGNHEWVDLGLPSGTLWATCNVGANSPEEYGDYFAWGETEPKDEYNWSAYKWCNGSSDTMTKYCTDGSYGYNGFTDYLTELQPEDDAATANWGSEWQMPSLDQIKELYNSNYTMTTWTMQNGVSGRLITSKVNGNSIFLPAAGDRRGTSLGRAGSYGDCWSRSLGTNYSDGAYSLCFDSGSIRWHYDSLRYSGRSVRPVRVQGDIDITDSEAIGVWTFDNTTDLMEGIGIATLQGSTHSNGNVTIVDDLSEAGISSVPGPMEGNGAITIPAGSSLRMSTNLNTSSLSTYSLLMDIHVTELNGYTALFQNDLTNASDGSLFIRNGQVGLGASELGYHGTLSSDSWHRVIFVVKDNMAKVFLNGKLVGQSSSANENKWLMSTGALFFADNDGEEHSVDVSEIRFWNKALTETQAWQLGSLGGNNSNIGVGEYVDLGLPSGTLWATCNIGANSPEEYGNYFAWGETNIKPTYNWDTYKYCSGSSTTMTKYCTDSSYGTVDNKTELVPTDDAATVNWGSEWQIPSSEQIDELMSNFYTTTTWTTQNGINGMLITSKNNGNSIFLPAAGFYSPTGMVFVGNRGYYWTRSLHPENSCDAYDIRFGVENIDRSDDLSRYFGQSIRAVRKHNSGGGGGGGSSW